MPKRIFILVWFALFFYLLFFLGVSAQSNIERITNFSSSIQIEKEGTLLVTENITVSVSGDKIKHGIYRDFPTKYKDKLGNNYKIDFELISVKKDGVAEPFHYSNLSNGIRIYIGDPNTIIPPGTYTYELSYRVNREIGFFSDHDELYWNVTGSGWDFMIEKSEAKVVLPFSIDPQLIKIAAYSGKVGSKDSSAINWSIDSSGQYNLIYFQNSKQLASGEDFSIVVGWPKGLITEPNESQKISFWLRDNLRFIFGFLGLLLVFLYYIIIWNKYGRDPQKESIIPIYEPPRGLSPSPVRYLLKRRYDEKCFLAEIINLAVKGYLKIEKKIKRFNLIKIKDADNGLNKGQEGLMNSLFSEGDVLELGRYDNAVLKSQESLMSFLFKSYTKGYFTKNIKYFILGVIFSLISISLFGGGAITLIISVWLLIWSFGVIFLMIVSAKTWKELLLEEKTKFGKFLGALFVSIITTLFLFAEFLVVYYFLKNVSISIVVIVLMAAALNIIFYFLLWQYTKEGLKLVNEIKGFKWFLSVTEKDRMNFFNPPEKTPELFEKYLPYAMALDVENEWAEQFAGVFAEKGMTDKNPLWYSAPIYGQLALSDFSNSFSRSIASSVTRPGSTSGFGGGSGGGSGGGGGGGGGGGW